MKLRLSGVVGFDILSDYIEQNLKEAEGETITIDLSSPGGSITEGLTIYNHLKAYERETIVIIDYAFSIASVFALAADKVVMKETGMFMIHRPHGAAMGENSEKFRSRADALDKYEDIIIDIYNEKTDIDKTELKQMLADETYLNADEALERGFIDEIQTQQSAIENLLNNAEIRFDMAALASKFERDTSISTLKDAERLLRNSGFSRKESVEVVSSIKNLHAENKKQDDLADMLRNFARNF